MTPTPTTLTSSWTSSDKLRQAVEVGLGTVRVAGGPLGGGDPEDELELFDKAAAIVTECKLRGLKVLFAFRIVEPGSYDEPRYYQKGRDWGNWLLDNPAPAEAITGFSIQNAWCNAIKAAYEAVIQAEAEAAAEAETTVQIPVITGFCRGDRDTYPAAEPVREAMPPAARRHRGLRRERRAPPHPHRRRRPPLPERQRLHHRAQRQPHGGAGRWSFSAKMNALLSFAFNTPGVAASMPLYVQEFNVNQHAFGWSLSEPTEQQLLEFEEASAAMRVVMDEIFGDARVRYGGAHSPWLTEQGDPYHFLVSIEYAYNVPEVDPLTPSGAAVKGYTPSP